ncbi:hypothetical protein GQ44DRAFT_804969 [Phaeosphaeriaceae sp. PMI808]|nr:hypothetical protein GQ44DRAFT_804969 [Phaeosphaeriaceae sp. PMI808]
MYEKRYGKAYEPFYYNHFGKNIILIVLSVITAPLSLTLVFISLVLSPLCGRLKPIHHDDSSQHKIILITGVPMTKGLTIARNLSQYTQHRIIGADISSLLPGCFSPSISKPYVGSILSIIQFENVDLWISCSSVVAAVEDGQANGNIFEVIQFNEDIVEKFHGKDKFIDYIAALNLNTPESYRCTSTDTALNILLRAFNDEFEVNGGKIDKKEIVLGKQFILKPIGVDDRARNAMMTLLPFSTPAQTKDYVHSLNISKENPFQLQQFIRGREYCTHALVIRGHVRAFTCCPSSELLMHYESLPANSFLNGGKTFTGHLSVDFLVEHSGQGEKDVVLYPIECNPRAHTAVVLFDDTPEMAEAYTSVFRDGETLNQTMSTPLYPRAPTLSYYWAGHDLFTFLVLPVLDAVYGRGTWQDVKSGLMVLLRHLIYWKDGTFTLADPGPFFVLYHLYWPARFIDSLRTGKQ